MMIKLFATSQNRYRASEKEKARYGGSTVTEFLVGVEGSNPSTWEKIMGYGPTPGERKSYAMAIYRERYRVPPWDARPGDPCMDDPSRDP